MRVPGVQAATRAPVEHAYCRAHCTVAVCVGVPACDCTHALLHWWPAAGIPFMHANGLQPSLVAYIACAEDHTAYTCGSDGRCRLAWASSTTDFYCCRLFWFGNVCMHGNTKWWSCTLHSVAGGEPSGVNSMRVMQKRSAAYIHMQIHMHS